MATNTGDSFGLYAQDASEFLPLMKQMTQNIKDREARQLILDDHTQEQNSVNSGLVISYGATIIANPKQIEGPHVEVVTFANLQHQSSAVDLRAGKLDVPNTMVVPLPADDWNTPVTETAATPSNHDMAVGIAENMNPANWSQSADLQVTIDELNEPTQFPKDEHNCCVECSICCKWSRQNCFLLRRGAKSLLQYWRDGFTARWKFLLMFAKVFIYFTLFVVAVSKFCIMADKGVTDSIILVCTLCGSIVSLVYTIWFCIRRRREVRIILSEMCTWIALAVYKCCCCCCKIRQLEELKMRREKHNAEHEAAEDYVDGIKAFRLPQNCYQKFTAILGNASEVLLTIADDVILTVVFILSLYNFMEKREFMIFYGSPKLGHIFGFVILVLSALKLIFVHGLRFLSIAVNVRALDKKVETNSEVMEVELPNKFIRYFLSFQARLVFHVLATSVFQLYGIFALSWKIIQDSCSAVEAPSTLVGNGTNGSHMDPISAGAPFTCSSHPLVNGFTIYNILYIAIVPTLLGYTSFFVCNTPWLVEYMQTITMWTYLQIEYTTGYRVREDDEVSGQGEVDRDANLCRVSERDAYMSPVLQLVRIFCGDLLCDVSDEDLREVGANAEGVRLAVLKNHNQDALKFSSSFLSKATMMFGRAMLFGPAVIIGVLQVMLFAVHLSFLGCCFTNATFAVLSPAVWEDLYILYIPLILLFLMTSFPGPLMGIYWVFIAPYIIEMTVTLVIAVVAGLVVLLTLAFFLVPVLCIFCFCIKVWKSK